MEKTEYEQLNRDAWNKKTAAHLESDFYDVEGFKVHRNSLPMIDRDFLGDVKGLSILHLQCHFGQDTLSLAHLGAQATGVDISDDAIDAAEQLNTELELDARFIRSAIYDLPEVLSQQFEVVYCSWGGICWLPDMHQWSALVHQYLKPGGRLVLCDFHPMISMFDDDQRIHYPYFNTGVQVETYDATYTGDETGPLTTAYWSHDFGEIIGNLLKQGFQLHRFEEYNHQPYPCYTNMKEDKPGEYVFEKYGRLIPYSFGLEAIKPE